MILLFDEGQGATVYDRSGSGSNGTIAGAAPPTWGPQGLVFGGGAGYVDISPVYAALKGKTAMTWQFVASATTKVVYGGLIGEISGSATWAIVQAMDSTNGGSDADSIWIAVSNGSAQTSVVLPGRLTATPEIITIRYLGGTVLEARRGCGTWTQQTTSVAAALNANATPLSIRLGTRSSVYQNGGQCAHVVTPRYLSDAECDQNARYLRALLAPRGVDLPLPEGDGWRAVAVGDSITAGGGIPGITGDTTYPHVLNDLINGPPRRLDDNQRMYNEGASGTKTAQMLATLPGHLADHTPWVVLIMGGTNDIGSVSAEDIEANISDMVAASTAAGAKVVLLTTPPNVNFLADGLVTLAAVNAWIAAQASESVLVADTWTALRDPATPDHLLAAYDSGDGTHPSAAGLHTIAETAYAAIHGAGWV